MQVYDLQISSNGNPKKDALLSERYLYSTVAYCTVPCRMSSADPIQIILLNLLTLKS